MPSPNIFAAFSSVLIGRPRRRCSRRSGVVVRRFDGWVLAVARWHAGGRPSFCPPLAVSTHRPSARHTAKRDTRRRRSRVVACVGSCSLPRRRSCHISLTPRSGLSRRRSPSASSPTRHHHRRYRDTSVCARAGARVGGRVNRTWSPLSPSGATSPGTQPWDNGQWNVDAGLHLYSEPALDRRSSRVAPQCSSVTAHVGRGRCLGTCCSASPTGVKLPERAHRGSPSCLIVAIRYGVRRAVAMLAARWSRRRSRVVLGLLVERATSDSSTVAIDLGVPAYSVRLHLAVNCALVHDLHRRSWCSSSSLWRSLPRHHRDRMVSVRAIALVAPVVVPRSLALHRLLRHEPAPRVSST